MWPLYRIVALGAVSTLLAVGCASSQQNRQGDSEEAEVQNAPPEEEPEGDVPEGPSVKLDGDIEKRDESAETRQRPTSDSDDSTGGRPAPKSTDGTDETGATVTPEEIRQLRKKGPSYVFRVVKLKPYRVDGNFRGYEIVGVTESARAEMEPQLAVGDVVTHVNDVRIERPDDYMKVWKELDDVDRIRIQYLRDGEEDVAVWRVVDER